MIELDDLRNLVNEQLMFDERCRNSDSWLIFCVWRKFSNITIPYGDFEKLPPAESITRCRRLVQHQDKLYLPTIPEVLEKRKLNEFRIKQFVREE